jgi:hypothetical protein
LTQQEADYYREIAEQLRVCGLKFKNKTLQERAEKLERLAERIERTER